MMYVTVGGRPCSVSASSLPRSVAEGALFTSSHAVLRRLSPGDGHPVLVLPGFLADDRSTAALRFHLRRLGYVTKGWRLGRNIGPTKAASTA